MIPKHRIPTHPGKILLEEFLLPLEVTQTRLAEHLRTSIQRVNEIVKGKRGIRPDTAILLSQAFNTSPEFWLNLQQNYDLGKEYQEKHAKIEPLPEVRRHCQ